MKFMYRMKSHRISGRTTNNTPKNCCIACWCTKDKKVERKPDGSCPKCGKSIMQQLMIGGPLKTKVY